MKVTIEIDVVPQERARLTRTGKAYDPPKSRAFKAQFRQELQLKWALPPFEGAVKVELQIYRRIKRLESKRYGDVDNLAKGILDAMKGICWVDDSQVVELHVWKHWSAEPRVDVEVEVASNEQVQEAGRGGRDMFVSDGGDNRGRDRKRADEDAACGDGVVHGKGRRHVLDGGAEVL